MRASLPNPVLGATFARAFEFASVVHATQTRKDTTIPYVSHLMGVASLVLEHGADEGTAIAALLHDAAEDQGGRAMLEQIAARFGPRVAAIVEGCTDTMEKPKPEWRTRKEQYIAHLAGADPAVCLVSAADKLHNARAILQDLRNVGPEVFRRFSASPRQTGWYYGAVANALHLRLAGSVAMPLAVALRHTVEEIASHKGAEEFREGADMARRKLPCPV